MTERYDDELREHTYDGIEEFDNRLPNWWLFILYGSIVFALGYWLAFHTLGVARLPQESYTIEMQEAAEAQLAAMAEGGLTDESLLLMSTLPERVEAGRQIFAKNCVACHLESGQGLVGPNLTDRYWIHGDRPLDIHRIVTDGVPSKGMAAWGRQLGPTRVQNVVAYVLAEIQNSEVPGKEPEGELHAE